MRKVLITYPERCSGCRICEMACSLAKEKECYWVGIHGDSFSSGQNEFWGDKFSIGRSAKREIWFF